MVLSIPIRILLSAALTFLTILGSATAQTHIDLKNPQPGVTSVGRAQEAGPVEIWHVQIGDSVKADDLVVSLECDRQKNAFEIAKLQEKNMAPIEAARAVVQKMEAKFTEGQGHHRRRRITDEQLKVLESDAQIAKASLKQAMLNKEVAKLNLELVEKLLERRYIRSQINGTVVAITKTPGEQARSGEDIVTVADSSNLAVEVPLSGKALSSLKPGDNFLVQTASGSQRLAQVASIQSLPQGAADSKLVSLLFANPDPENSDNPEAYQMLLPEGIETAPPPPPTPKATKEKP